MISKDTEYKVIIKSIWEMSKALYNSTVETSDVTKSNYRALTKVNKYCAEILKMLEEKYENKK